MHDARIDGDHAPRRGEVARHRRSSGRRLSAPALAAVLGCAVAAAQQPPAATVRVVGRVVAVTRDGVPAAEVWATDDRGNRLGRAVADGEGWYQLVRLPAVPLRIHARADGKVDGAVAVDASGPVRAATPMLEDGEPLRGVVVGADGTPVAGAAVLVCAEPRAPAPFDWFEDTVTNARGEWSVRAVPLRPLALRVWAQRCTLAETVVPDDRGPVVRTTLAASAAEPRRIAVRGLAAPFDAVVRCDVGLERGRAARRLPAAMCEARVQADGSASLSVLPVDHEIRLVAAGHRSMPVYVPCRAHDARAHEFLMSPLPQEALAPRTTLTGTLRDEHDRPIAGVAVVGRLRDTVGAPATSGADGGFVVTVPAPSGVLCELALLSSERHLVGPDARLGADGRTWSTVSALPGEPLRLRTAVAGGLAGTLLAPNGAPLAGARVELEAVGGDARQRPRVATASDPAGGIDVRGLPPGAYDLRVVQEGGASGACRVEIVPGLVVAPGPLAFTLGGELHGTVKDREGRPVRGAALWLAPVNRRVPPPMRRHMLTSGAFLLTDRDGRFRTTGLAPGEWTVACGVDAVRDDAVVAEQFAVEPGATVTLQLTAPR